MQAKSRNDDAFWRKHVLPNFRPSISEKIPQKTDRTKAEIPETFDPRLVKKSPKKTDRTKAEINDQRSTARASCPGPGSRSCPHILS
jgi:hypothetical protein